MTRILAALLFTCGSAFAADPDAVKAPFVEAGDCWTYRATGLESRGRIDGYEICVSLVDTAKGRILAVATVKGDGREIDTSFTLQWGESRTVSGMILQPATEFLKFPLRVGDKHKVAFDYRAAGSSYLPGRLVMYVEVERWEDIEVPAGRFRALKIVGEGRASVQHVTQTTPVTRTWWYAPEVNRFVKYVQRMFSNSYSEELTGYQLTK